MQPVGGVTYIPTSRGWVQASTSQPFHSQAPPVPAGVNHDVWRVGSWWENSVHREAPIQNQATWLPHPAWYSGDHGTGPTALDIERVQWLWVPRGVNVYDPAGYPASWSGGHSQTPQTEDSLPPSLPTSRVSDLAWLRALERVRNGRDSPYPRLGQLPPVDDNYGPYRINASPRAANASSQRHAHGVSRSNTHPAFGTPESTMSPPVIPPPVIPSSSSYHHPSHNNPPGSSSHARGPPNPSSSSYPGLPLRHNPLPPPPEHNPVAQELLRKAKRPTTSDACNR